MNLCSTDCFANVFTCRPLYGFHSRYCFDCMYSVVGGGGLVFFIETISEEEIGFGSCGRDE
jgi:hypothetical protein